MCDFDIFQMMMRHLKTKFTHHAFVIRKKRVKEQKKTKKSKKKTIIKKVMRKR